MSGMEAASDDLIELVVNYYGEHAARNADGLGPDAENIIGALAAITADQLVSLCVPPEKISQASRWISGKDVDDFLYLRAADTLFIIITSGALASGVAYADLPDMAEIVQRASMGDDLAIVPALTVDEHYFPSDWPPNAAVRFRGQVQAILDKRGVKGEERVMACALSVSKMLVISKEMFEDLEIPLLIALETLAGVARMTPLQTELA